MSIYYNTAAPTPSTKNNITDIAVTYGIRDYLLNKNLLPVYPQISTSLNGSPRIGEPVLDTAINGNSNVTPFGLPLEIEGLLRYEIAVLPNKFKNTGSGAPTLLNITDVSITPGVFGEVGFPQGIQNYPTSSNQTVEEYGLIGKTEYASFRKKSTLLNLYLDSTKQIDMADFISLQPAGFSQQLNGYTDNYGGLNLGGSPAIQAGNVIGSVLNGQGLGLAKGGVVTNFDLRSSLAGRVLGATGLINDTKLGMIGGQQLALALANNAAFNTQQAILGGLNVQDNVLALVKGGPLPGLRPNYKITIPSSTVGQVLDYTSRILGFTLPRSFLSDAGSIFSSENQSGNIDRANSMIENTGKGQVVSLISNINTNLIGSGKYDNPETTSFRSGYSPGYLNSKGQKAVNPNLYAFYDDKTKGSILNFLNSSTDSKNLIPEISYNRSNMISKYGFRTPEETFSGPKGNVGYDNRVISNIGFTWTSTNGDALNSKITSNSRAFPDELVVENNPADGSLVHAKKSLLGKTQKLFNSKGMLNIVSAKGDTNHTSSQIETANAGAISKGSAVLMGSKFVNGIYDGSKDEAENTFCRSWTTLDRYDKVQNLIRNSALYGSGKVPYRFQTQNSTLGNGGFVKIAPYTSDINQIMGGKDGKEQINIADPKNFMFSIENLAWADEYQNLPPVEIGMGDLLTGKKGRIMWFPPYNIQFSESSNVSWESNNFIGRGESVYTYNNTERSGNLSFSVVVDHSSYTNAFRDPNGPDDNYIASFMAGCIDPNTEIGSKLTVSEKSSIVETQTTIQQEAVITPELAPDSFMVYFPNDSVDMKSSKFSSYENGLSGSTANDKINYSVYDSGFGIDSFVGGVTSKTPWNDNHNYGLNGWKSPIEVDGVSYSGFSDPAYGPALANYLNTKCKFCVVKITSYASPQGKPDYNKKLADGRTASVKDYLINSLGVFSGKDKDFISKRFPIQKNVALTSNESSCSTAKDAPTDTFACKVDRRTSVVFEFSNELAALETIKPAPIIKTQTQNVNTKITNRLYDESKYFEQLTETDNFVFDRFREKIKYFHPAFHSTTPEGLNSRLTFLHQCTRQGGTLENKDANNLSFGRPPICILRLGDFYNTKIVIDNINIDYEPLVWDLNPEGIGVQPMIANVTMSFKFIGGSTLMGPINKLQNALSFNYYANTHVYDPRADYIAKSDAKSSKLGDYMLVKGERNLQGFNKPPITTTETAAVAPSADVNQVIADDLSNSGNKAATTDDRNPDLVIFENAKILNKGYLSSLGYDGTKLKGRFGLGNEGYDLLSKDYDAKLSIISEGGQLEIASFKIGGKNSEHKGYGDFLSAKDGWKEALNTIAEPNGVLQFSIKIPEFPNLNVFWFNRGFARFDCPEQDIKYSDIVNLEDWKDIEENPCFECYSKPYSGGAKPVIIHGKTCPFSGTTS